MDTLNPYSRLRAAAGGDLEAQRDLREAALDLALNSFDTVAAVEGLTFARLAWAQGDKSDALRLLAMIATALMLVEDDPAETDWTLNLHGEGLAVLNHLADQGEEVAAAAINQISEGASAHALACAAHLNRKMESIQGGAE